LFGYGRVFVRAEDVWIWDHEGRKYLDFLAAFGASSLGHSHPKLVARMREWLDEKALNLNHIGPSGPAAELAEALAQRAGEGLSVAMFSSTGGEAVESALKLCRAPFEPLLEHCEAIPFGDLAALEKALAPRRAAAFLVEPILGEGGVILP